MANKYCNLYGPIKIKDDYHKINDGFRDVEADITFNLNSISDKQAQIDANLDKYNAHVAETSDLHNAIRIIFDSASDPNLSATEVQSAIEQVSARVTNIIAQSGTSSSEVVDAHISSIFNVTYDLIKERFEEIERLLAIDDGGVKYKVEKNVVDDHLVINFEEVL